MHSCKDACAHVKRIVSIALCLVMAIALMPPVAAHAQEPEQKVVRVGWFDSSFCYWDQFGRRCGIDYEYQHRISAYTGWTYEYVEDSWPNLLQMLKNGEIDLLSDVSYTPERTEYISYSDLPMGSESYYIYVDGGNKELSASNLASFNGTRIGVNAGSVQETFLKEWAEKNGIAIEVVPLDVEEDESMGMVRNGELDGYAAIYTFSSEYEVVPICRVGASEYFYAVNKDRPDLLAELNMALAGIQDEDPYFIQRLNDERFYVTREDAFLSPSQEDWLVEHGTVRVGYRQDFLPFCQTDKEKGELTGALKDYLAHVLNNLKTSNLSFETKPYPSTAAALEAMKAGEVDCVFPVYLSSYDSNEMGIRLTDPLMTTEVNALMCGSDSKDLSQESALVFAVSEGDVNIETFIKDQYPASSCKSFASTEACFAAVASGDADCTLISNYRVPSTEDLVTKYKLFTVPTGESLPFSFAVNKSDRELYFLLNKTTVMTKSEDMDTALASYMRTDQKVSFTDFVKDNWLIVLIVLVVLFCVIIFLLLQKLRAERTAHEHQKLMEESLRRELAQKEQLQSAMEMAYRDSLTGVKSKRAYNETEERLNQCITDGTVSEFGVAVFDLNDLKMINDNRGHEVGDEYIKDACKLICTCFKHSPVFRVGGDEFAVILEGEDYANRDELLERFEKQVLVNLKHDKAVVAFGCSCFNPLQDTSVRMVFERADSTMYREKELLKSFGADTDKSESEKPNYVAGFEDLSVLNVRKHILIAEDIESSRDVLGDLLQDEYDIYFAADGVEAMDILHRHKDEIAIVLLDLYMPNMSGREVMTQMQIDEDLMSIPVIFLSVDQEAELDCLKIGAMDFIPKPYPDDEIIKARIARCIELSENRDLISRTQRDRLTGLFNIDYFFRYVYRYDQHYKGAAFDAVACRIDQYHAIIKQYGQQFGDLALRSIGVEMSKLARRIGGIACRQEGDTFLLYCLHQDGYEQLIGDFVADLFVEEETANIINLKFGVFANAQQEPDIEERFVRAKIAADNAASGSGASLRYYEYGGSNQE